MAGVESLAARMLTTGSLARPSRKPVIRDRPSHLVRLPRASPDEGVIMASVPLLLSVAARKLARLGIARDFA